MKQLKHLAGILLATVGVMFALGSVFHVIDPDPEIPLWIVGVMFLLLGLLPLGVAFAFLRATLTAPSKSCPQCNDKRRHPAGILRSSQDPRLFHFGGWLFAALWGASREQQFRCANCETLYLTDTRGTRIAGVCFWVFLLLVVGGVIVEIFDGR